jgi:ABC-type lipoprotein release transport system permease subunit
MTAFGLIRRSLRYYCRTNLAVIGGVAVAVSVLAGALLVGDSVRGSLKDLFLDRLGRASLVLSASHFFPEDLSSRIDHQPTFQKRFRSACPLIVTQGVVTHQESRRRASEVRVYGVDERFWRFHDQPSSGAFELSQRDALVSQPLATEIGIQLGDSVLLRLEAPSEIPAESLHGRRENRGRTVRLTARQVLPPGGLGEFSLNAEQQSVKAIFVPLGRLQKELDQAGQVNSLLVADGGDGEFSGSGTEAASELERIVRDATTLEDMGVRLRRLTVPARELDSPGVECLSLEKASTLLDDRLVAKAREAAIRCGLAQVPVLTYLANRIRIGNRQVPYSLVAAVEPDLIQPLTQRSTGSSMTSPIWLNQWAAEDLNATVGNTVTLEYYLWKEEGQLATQTTEFQLAGIVPIQGIAADRNLVPDYPGISDSDTLSDWDPPFPMDLGLIRPKDEAYWKEYRATPKAFIALADGQRLWRSRFGVLTSMRFTPNRGDSSTELGLRAEKFRQELRAKLSPFEMGFALLPVKAQGLVASRGTTDFGEYFTYFSFFLVASALLLATLFFRLGVEQRLKEVGLLKALGFPPQRIRNLFLLEGLLLSAAGSLAGVCGAAAYASLMMLLLRTWWVGAVGTTALSLHISAGSLVVGAVGGVLSAAGCVGWTLRRMMPASPRGLLAGVWTRSTPAAEKELWERGRLARIRASNLPTESSDLGERARRPRSQRGRQVEVAAISFCLLGGMLLAGAGSARIGAAAGFFGAGISFLVSLLCLQSVLLRRTLPSALKAARVSTLWRLGYRQASDRPGRSVLCIALIASATFIIVAVDAFRRDRTVFAQVASSQQPLAPSGTGGFALMGESLLPIFQNWNVPEGRDALGFSAQDSQSWGQSSVVRFRVRAGEDASCLNLFQPRKPRILAPEHGLRAQGLFAFKECLASDEAEKRNPWLVLDRSFPDGAVPVIGDANSLEYVLHLKVGEDWLLEREGREAVKLRVVAALADSLFQRELLMSEQNFKRLFPEQQGYRFFLFDVPADRASELSQLLEERLSDEGLDVSFTAERLAGFHRVENTYLSTFQFLGGLGLLLGTLGLGIVLLRNVLERRRELALLRAVGYTPRHLATIVASENVFLLLRGTVIGAVSALLAILPAIASRGWRLPSGSVGWLLIAVLLAGLAASLLATRAAVRTPLLEALRSE